MSIVNQTELRYISISAFALTILSAMMAFTGQATDFLDLQYKDLEPVDTTDYWNNFSGGSIFDSTPFDTVVSTILAGFDSMMSVYAGWDIIIQNAGWASAFVIVPTIIMSLVIIGAVIKVIKVLPFT